MKNAEKVWKQFNIPLGKLKYWGYFYTLKFYTK